MAKWIFKNVPARLNELDPKVRDKALEIAQKLIVEKKITEDKAIKKGIQQAEEWFLNSQG